MASRKKRKQKQNQGSTRESSPTESTAPRTSVWPLYFSSLLLYAANAPLNQAWCAWLAPIGFLWFAEQSAKNEARFGRREWLHGWLAGCLFWLPILQGIRLAFWPLYAGWLALALYLAIYTPLFVYGVRNLTRRGIPLLLSAPLLWVGFEFIRSYMLSGYCASMLGHTQAYHPRLIQIADMLGVYGISALVMVVAVAIYGWLRWRTEPRDASQAANHLRLAVIGSLIAVGMLAGTVFYGNRKLAEAEQLDKSPLLRVLLVQENQPSMFDLASLEDLVVAWDRYEAETIAQAKQHGPIDLVVWPESTFTADVPWMVPELPDQLPPELQDLGMTTVRQRTNTNNLLFRDKCLQLIRGVERETQQAPHLLVGCDSLDVTAQGIRRFNSALFIAPDGTFSGRYSKMHLVMFGEYIPLGKLLSWLGDLFGFAAATPGNGPESFEVGQVRVSPNVCFETMMPRVIQSQVAELTSRQQSPDVLVNVTNDSWFRGSSMLDHHLACSILCAVENRRPLLTAANSGLTVAINGSGEVVDLVERFQIGGVLAEPYADGRWGLVQAIGYPLAWVGFLLALFACWPPGKPSASESTA